MRSFFTNQSSGAETYQWVFQGGTPFISAEENPVVTYNTPGTYNVTLTVTSGGASSTEVKEDYITVLAVPGQVEGEDLVCEWTEETYSVEENAGSTYTWAVTNGEIISGQGTNMVNVLWHDPGTGYLSIDEQTVYLCGGMGGIEVTIDECTGLEEYDRSSNISIAPNPVTGSEFMIHTGDVENVFVEVYNMNGILMHKGYIQSGTAKLHSHDFPAGLYILKATIAGNGVEVVKFIKR
jgi:PKD repeat protein